jgi:hypothetical protein
MKQFFLTLLLFLSSTAFADVGDLPGLTYTSYYETAGATPTRSTTAYPVATTGVLNTFYIPNSGGMLGASRTNMIMVHITGYMEIMPTANLAAGTSVNVTFYDQSDDGFSLALNGTYVINNWREQGCSCSVNWNGASNSNGSTTMVVGQLYAVDAWYYNNQGGYGMQLYWNVGGSVTNIPAGDLYRTIIAYSSSITTAQQTDVTRFNNTVISGNAIYLRQSGNNDSITIKQIGSNNLITGVGQQFAKVQDGNNTINIKQGNINNLGKNEVDLSVAGGSNSVTITEGYDINGTSAGNNYQLVGINGIGNTVTTSQTNDGGNVGHFLEAVINGNYNTVGIVQSNNTQKQIFASITGNNNTITTSQTGTGQHYLNITETGNGNSAVVNQSGNTNNAATIVLNNQGAPASVNLTQTGGQVYSITQTCVTTCGTVTVKQGT